MVADIEANAKPSTIFMTKLHLHCQSIRLQKVTTENVVGLRTLALQEKMPLVEVIHSLKQRQKKLFRRICSIVKKQN
ncbi:hypothetical protein O9992_14435 [Vibrio lentus]|nr:hypothetical protein [Vibrio lentus]